MLLFSREAQRSEEYERLLSHAGSGQCFPDVLVGVGLLAVT